MQARKQFGVYFFVVSFLLVAACWAIVSPFGSSADDDYHLASIYCMRQDIGICKVAEGSSTVSISGVAVLQPQNGIVQTSHLNIQGSRPQLFYWAMGQFVNKDVIKSALIVRALNGMICGLILYFALIVSINKVREVLKITWGICIIPVGIFYIVSANPSSWVITSVGTFWAFALSSTQKFQPEQRARKFAMLGAVLTSIMAIGSRNEAGIYLLIALLATFLLSHNRKRESNVRNQLAVLAASIPAIIVTAVFIFKRFSENIRFMLHANYLHQSPNPVLNALIEFPRYFASHFGGQILWFQGNFTYAAGVGWLNFLMPSITGLFIVSAIAVTIVVSFSEITRQRVLTICILWASFLTFTLGSLGLGGFDRSIALQPRYTLPFVIALIGLTIFNTSNLDAPILNRFQALIVASLIWFGSVAAWQRTATFYSNDVSTLWMSVTTKPIWWWHSGPTKLTWLGITLMSTLLWAISSIIWPTHELATRLRSNTSEDLSFTK